MNEKWEKQMQRKIKIHSITDSILSINEILISDIAIEFYIWKYVQHILNVWDKHLGISVMAFTDSIFSNAYHLQKKCNIPYT